MVLQTGLSGPPNFCPVRVRKNPADFRRGGVVSYRRRKTGAPVDIPLLPELQVAIDAMPKAAHLTFLVTEFGKPFTAAGFGNWFREQCDLADVAKSAHGLRKAGATRLAEHGCARAHDGWRLRDRAAGYTGPN